MMFEMTLIGLIAALILLNFPKRKAHKKPRQTWADCFREDIHERRLKL